LELMIAMRSDQKCGYGRSALLCFLRYLLRHEDVIVRYFLESQGFKPPVARERPLRLAYLYIKVGAGNVGSIRLFESLGFTKIRETPDVFGELELRRDLNADDHVRAVDIVDGLMGEYGVEEYAEVPFCR
ncbi:hypothetical protein KEM55_000206, partial [Ascosphaera atra]